jgi:hypothetical protein
LDDFFVNFGTKPTRASNEAKMQVLIWIIQKRLTKPAMGGNVDWHYAVAEDIKRLSAFTRKSYGKDVMETLAASTKCSLEELRLYGRVAMIWTLDEVKALADRHTGSGTIITWPHLMIVASLRTKKECQAALERCFAERLTAQVLGESLKDEGRSTRTEDSTEDFQTLVAEEACASIAARNNGTVAEAEDSADALEIPMISTDADQSPIEYTDLASDNPVEDLGTCETAETASTVFDTLRHHLRKVIGHAAGSRAQAEHWHSLIENLLDRIQPDKIDEVLRQQLETARYEQAAAAETYRELAELLDAFLGLADELQALPDETLLRSWLTSEDWTLASG